MKSFIISIFLLSFTISWSQGTIDIFQTKTVTFYGLDFSLTKCIGQKKFPTSEELIEVQFPYWNNIFMTDEYKIDIGHPYKKKEVYYDTMVNVRNANIDPKELMIQGEYHLERKQINNYILQFADYNKTGLGLIYVVEALNSSEKYASVWITFFDIKTGKVLLAEPMRAKGKGRKIKDYWKNAFLDIYDESHKDYKAWKKAY